MLEKTKTMLTTAAAAAMLFGSAHAGVVFSDNFNGTPGVDLNGLAPDDAPGAETWVAASTFNADGAIEDTAGASATLAFTPVDGFVYTLDVSYRNIAATGAAASTENDWVAMGFVNGQSDLQGNNERFVGGNVNGIAWMMMRGVSTASVGNKTFLGTAASGTQSNTGSADYTDVGLGAAYGADMDMRVVLDTTGGAGTWTATWYAKFATDATYTEVGPATLLADEAIDSVGIARSNTGFTGQITNFNLDAVPEPGSMSLIALGGLLILKRRRHSGQTPRA